MYPRKGMMSIHLAPPQQTSLGKALSFNAIGTAIFGSALVMLPLHEWLGVADRLTLVVGTLLVVYAVLLALVARSSRWLVRGGRAAVLGDAGWTFGALAVIVFTDVMSTGGEVALGLSAVFTGVFAFLEYKAAKALG